MYLQQLQQQKNLKKLKFFTLFSFKHSAFQDLRRYSRVPAFTIWGVPSAYSIVVSGRN